MIMILTQWKKFKLDLKTNFLAIKDALIITVIPRELVPRFRTKFGPNGK